MHRSTLVALLLWTSGFTVAVGGMSAQRSHAVLSADGKRILVMVSPTADFDGPHPVAFSLPDGRTVVLRDTFQKSGAYDSATLVPIWQVDWFSLKGDLCWSADLGDVVRLNRFGLTSDWALAFYHDGRPVRRYDCKYLLTAFRHERFLPYETWDWHTAWYDVFEFDQNRLRLSTARRRLSFGDREFDLGFQEFYTFDMSTGAVIAFSTVGSRRIWWYFAGVVFVVCVIPLLFWFRRRKRSRQSARSEHSHTT